MGNEAVRAVLTWVLSAGTGVAEATRALWKAGAPRWHTLSMWVVMCSASAALAQVVFTTDDLDRAMKAVGRNVALATTAIDSKDVAEAKVRVARAREQLSPTISFWQNGKRPDAMKMVREATARLDDLDTALSASPVDMARVTAAAAGVDRACQACHTVYREEDPAAKTFRLKPAAAGVSGR
jgi:hypothetical protein